MSRLQSTLYYRFTRAALDTTPEGRDSRIDNETLYKNRWFLGNFRKTLPTTDGKVNEAQYQQMITALATGVFPDNFPTKLIDPFAGNFLELAGPEASCVTIGKSPPRIDSVELARDLVGLYALSLARDVPFTEYGSSPLVARLATELGLTPATIFRQYRYPGPFVSQVFISNQIPIAPPINHVATREGYDYTHSGGITTLPTRNGKRHAITLRDLAEYVRTDYPNQPADETILFLMKKYPSALINPYAGKPYIGFLSFGTPFLLELTNKANAIALKAAWYYKWMVHRFLRPEELAYEVDRVYNHRIEPYQGAPHDLLYQSTILVEIQALQGNVLLSQVYPNGAPAHPSAPSGHATSMGAVITILKACFKYDFVLPETLVPNVDGSALISGPPGLLLGDELNKLAMNISIGRSTAGIRYYLDNEMGFRLGEKVALVVLQEAKCAMNIPGFNFTVKKFDGTNVTI